MRTLDLFCGTKSFSKIAKEEGYETHTLDILEQFNPSYRCNLMRNCQPVILILYGHRLTVKTTA